MIDDGSPVEILINVVIWYVLVLAFTDLRNKGKVSIVIRVENRCWWSQLREQTDKETNLGGLQRHTSVQEKTCQKKTSGHL